MNKTLHFGVLYLLVRLVLASYTQSSLAVDSFAKSTTVIVFRTLVARTCMVLYQTDRTVHTDSESLILCPLSRPPTMPPPSLPKFCHLFSLQICMYCSCLACQPSLSPPRVPLPVRVNVLECPICQLVCLHQPAAFLLGPPSLHLSFLPANLRPS